jgi:hypothetical protein
MHVSSGNIDDISTVGGNVNGLVNYRWVVDRGIHHLALRIGHKRPVWHMVIAASLVVPFILSVLMHLRRERSHKKTC